MSTRITLALTLAAAGCGSVTTTAGPDAETNDEVDAGDPAPDARSGRCDPAAAFSTPVLVAELNSASADGGAQLSPDELTVYFHSSRNGDFDLFFATRADPGEPFGPPTAITGVNLAGETDAYPTISRDGLTLYFMRSADVWRATRASTAQPFTSPVAVAELNTAAIESHLALGDQRLGFSRGDWGADDDDLYQADVLSDGMFSAPEKLVELSVQGVIDVSPISSADGLRIYWGSHRLDGGAQGRDIWFASRASLAGPWSSAARVAALGSPAEDTPTWLADDDCRLYLNSDRPGSEGMDIYLASR